MASRSPLDRLRRDGGVVPLPGWSLLEVTGADRERYLNSQVTSDVRALPPGGTQLSALLDRSGRVRSFFFLHRRSAAFVLLTPPDVGDMTAAALLENAVADDVVVRRLAGGPLRMALGLGALRLLPGLPGESVVPLAAFGLVGFVTWAAGDLDLPQVEGSLLRALRILAGPPRWGADAPTGRLVNETALMSLAVAPDKGCYLGQETVAKVASHRGAAVAPAVVKVAGRLAAIDPLVGAEITVGRTKAGRVIDAAPWDGGTVLGVELVRRFRVEGLPLAMGFAGGLTAAGTVAVCPAIRPPSAADCAAELHQLAVAAYAEDDGPQAENLLAAALVVCPTSADALESLGVILGRRGELDRATALMHRLLELDPDSVLAHTNLSRFYGEQGRVAEAEEEMRLATAAAMRRRRPTAEPPETASPAAGPESEPEVERRESLFRRVLEVDPDDAVANFELGRVLRQRGELEAGIEHLGRALTADPDDPRAYLELGRALEAARRPGDAREVWERGVGVAARSGRPDVAGEIQAHLAS